MVSLPTQYPILKLGTPTALFPASHTIHHPYYARTTYGSRADMSHGGITVASSATKLRKKTGRFVHFASHATDASRHISSILPWTNRRADMYPLRDRHLMRGATFLTTISISANVASPSQLSVQCLVLFLYPLATPHPHDLGLPRRPRHLP